MEQAIAAEHDVTLSPKVNFIGNTLACAAPGALALAAGAAFPPLGLLVGLVAAPVTLVAFAMGVANVARTYEESGDGAVGDKKIKGSLPGIVVGGALGLASFTGLSIILDNATKQKNTNDAPISQTSESHQVMETSSIENSSKNYDLVMG